MALIQAEVVRNLDDITLITRSFCVISRVIPALILRGRVAFPKVEIYTHMSPAEARELGETLIAAAS